MAPLSVADGVGSLWGSITGTGLDGLAGRGSPLSDLHATIGLYFFKLGFA
jgi:hypothetical protein